MLRGIFTQARCFSAETRQAFLASVEAGTSGLPDHPRFARKENVKLGSSVLVPLVDGGSPALPPSVLFTKRSTSLRAHRGEVCFPGGKAEKGESLVQTALRETEEETGLGASSISVWSPIQPVLTSLLDRAVTPVVGYLHDPHCLQSLQISHDEVVSVFSVPISHLLSVVSSTLFVHPKFRYRLPAFPVRNFTVHAKSGNAFIPAEFRIWGLSAVILHQVLCHLEPERYKAVQVMFR